MVRSEKDLATYVCDLFPIYGYPLSTQFVLAHFPEVCDLSDDELANSPSRKDAVWTQRIRNVISHANGADVRVLSGLMVYKVSRFGDNGKCLDEWLWAPEDASMADIGDVVAAVSFKDTGVLAPGTLAAVNEKKQKVGDIGEDIAVTWLKKYASKMWDKGAEVEHTSRVRGDGYGYDARVIVNDVDVLYVEIKSTTSKAASARFHMSCNEYRKFDEAVKSGSDKWSVLCVTDVDVTNGKGRVFDKLITPQELMFSCGLKQKQIIEYSFGLPAYVQVGM